MHLGDLLPAKGFVDTTAQYFKRWHLNFKHMPVRLLAASLTLSYLTAQAAWLH